MIENEITVDKGDYGVVQVSVGQLDDSPELVRFKVREACGEEEYEVDCWLELDDMEYIAHRILDAVAYQRKQNFGVLSEAPVAVPPEELFTSHETREYYALKALLEKHLGDRKAAARELGISERTLYRKLSQYKLI